MEKYTYKVYGPSKMGKQRQCKVCHCQTTSQSPCALIRTVSRAQLMQLLNNAEFRSLISTPATQARRVNIRTAAETAGPKPPPQPTAAGQALMRSGIFGSNAPFGDDVSAKNRLARRLLARELATDRTTVIRTNKLISQSLLPSTHADTIIHYDEPCYSGQFSDDGNFFFSCSKDFLVRMYDTSNPYEWRHYKSVEFTVPQWTITDATLSPDNNLLAYSSITSHICLSSTDPEDTQHPRLLDFTIPNQPRDHRGGWMRGGFGVCETLNLKSDYPLTTRRFGLCGFLVMVAK